MLLQNVGDMKTVGLLVHVQVPRCTKTEQQQPNNVVNQQEITNLFVNVPMAMAGMEDTLKSEEKSIANALEMAVREKKRQQWSMLL